MKDITPSSYEPISAKDKILIPVLDYSMGETLGGWVLGANSLDNGAINKGTMDGRSTETIADAINVSGDFVNDVINARLDTASETILGEFSFGASGAIQIGEYDAGVSGDIKISPSGILARNSANATTIAIDGTTGEITAISLTSATGNIGGWVIAATSLYYDGATDALSSGMSSVDYPFYAGKKYADRATAPYRVTPAGVVNMTGAIVDGTSTIGGRTASTLASAINTDGHFIDDALNTSSKAMLKGFDFGSTDYSGALKSGDIAWNTTTGAITGGSGVLVYRGGIIGAKAGVAKFTLSASTGDATFAGTLSAPTGTLGKITATELIVGNVERNDFHWLTFFESLDGFQVIGTTITSSYVEIETAATTNADAYILKNPQYNFDILSWAKDRKVRTNVRFDDNTAQEVYILTGQPGALAHIGFKVHNSIFNGTVANGTTESTVSLGANISAGDTYSLEYRFTSGEKVVFYVDGVEAGTITTNLPSGPGNYSDRLIQTYVKTTENVAKSIKLSFWDFWQSA